MQTTALLTYAVGVLTGCLVTLTLSSENRNMQAPRRLAHDNSAHDSSEVPHLLGLSPTLLELLPHGDPANIHCDNARCALQRAYVRFHNWMYEQEHLPIRAQHQHGHHTQPGWMQRTQWGLGRPSWNGDFSILSRIGFILFNQQQAHRAPPNAACLSWDTPTPALELVPSCARERVWSLKYKPDLRINTASRILQGDLTNLGSSARALPETLREAFDIVLCNQARSHASSSTPTILLHVLAALPSIAPYDPGAAVKAPGLNLPRFSQVFEHISRPFEAAKGLFALTKRGGHVLWTAPFADVFHKVPNDFFRYTCDGGEHLPHSSFQARFATCKATDNLVIRSQHALFLRALGSRPYMQCKLATRC